MPMTPEAIVSILFGMFVFAVWVVIAGSFAYFYRRVVPSALGRWAEDEGYRIIEQKRAGMLEWHSFARGSGHWVYRVAVQDKAGQIRRGLVRVGTPYWVCLHVSRCPVEARWDSADGPRGLLPGIAARVRALTGTRILAGEGSARRTVLIFAFLDLLLALLVLAFETMLLLGIALAIERLSGKLLSPEQRRDELFVTVGAVGMFILYLPALVGLWAGGIGLIARRPWGYYGHLVGVVGIAVSIFGIVYTIPAFLVAMQPRFKACCLGKQVAPA